jgi:hypothetical protein
VKRAEGDAKDDDDDDSTMMAGCGADLFSSASLFWGSGLMLWCCFT